MPMGLLQTVVQLSIKLQSLSFEVPVMSMQLKLWSRLVVSPLVPPYLASVKMDAPIKMEIIHFAHLHFICAYMYICFIKQPNNSKFHSAHI